ncbi:MAG: lysostaphin resistance A-like protein [Enterococcus sp.]
MKIPLNESIQLTKEQRKGFVPAVVLLGLIAIIFSQYFFSVFSTNFSNPGWREVYDNFSTFGVILFTLALCRVVEKRTPASLGFTKKNSGQNYLIGLGAGLFLVSLIILLNILTGASTISFEGSQIKWGYVLLSFVGYMGQGLMEETVSRGFIMNSIASRYGILAGILINSYMFASLHQRNAGFTWLGAGLNIFLIGVMFSLLFYYTNSIWINGALHTVWNFSVGPIFGVQVSGMEPYSSIFSTENDPSKSLINGDAFGIEAGITTPIVIIFAIVGLIYLIKKKTWESIIASNRGSINWGTLFNPLSTKTDDID